MRGFSLADAMELMFSDLYQFEQLYKKFSTMAAELHTCTYKIVGLTFQKLQWNKELCQLSLGIRKDTRSVQSCSSSVLISLFLFV